jgi:hypothetical protein
MYVKLATHSSSNDFDEFDFEFSHLPETKEENTKLDRNRTK